ncbi:MAG: DNA mismatch endonuclease Vsr [Caulobacter sp.]|nr:DNA mismatch endonuclease Vsr [Caulobacter sp.]
MDTVDPLSRSANMSKVRNKDTGPEIFVRRVAHRMGLRFRLHRKDLPGTPDLVFPKHRLAVFVHGCFWHRHEGCRRASMPSTRVEFWEAKFAATVARDARQIEQLKLLGWRVIVIWECTLKNEQKLQDVLSSAVFGLDAPRLSSQGMPDDHAE